jgi:hypothetical protein
MESLFQNTHSYSARHSFRTIYFWQRNPMKMEYGFHIAIFNRPKRLRRSIMQQNMNLKISSEQID